jgi:hypothetical protein
LSAASCGVDSGARESVADALSEPPHDGVRERDGALEAGRADELDALVRRRVRRHRLDVAELVAPSRSAARTAGRASARAGGRASRSRVERTDALHRPVGELHGEGAVALVEASRPGAERAVRVGVLLEDTADDLVYATPRARVTRPAA